VVAPGELPEEEIKAAIKSCGWDEFDRSNARQLIEVICSYGCGKALIWDGYSNNYRKLMKQARDGAYQQLSMPGMGFAMDRPQNAIGSTGWDFLKGDITAGLRRYSEGDDDNKKIMRKMYGMPTTLEEAEKAVAKGDMKLEEEE